MSKLLIVESPGKIKTLKGILGRDWEIAASVGHIADLPKKRMGIRPNSFDLEYELTERGAEVLAKLKKLASSADAVYLGTDPDREGEAIAWHLQQFLKLKNYQRISFPEITAQAVQAAVAAPRQIDMALVHAQEARRALDRLVGYTVSPALSDHLAQNLSAGRVQSVALRLVVDRERQIRVFKATNHFGAMLVFQGAQGTWTAEWKTLPDFVTEENPYFMDRDFAGAVAAIRQVRALSCKESTATRSPPPPFITSTLQRAANVAMGLKPAKTMELAQKLYEQGHITYHRTDNPNLSAESLPSLHAVATALSLEVVNPQRRFKASDSAQAGHPAITPTHWEVEEAGEDSEQRKLYQMIRLRAIACQLTEARYAVRKVSLESMAPLGDKAIVFDATGRTLTQPGWLQLLDGDATSEEEVEPSKPVPSLETGQVISADDGKLLEKKTKAPPRYTQASLVEKLESEGIGRPATFAAVMANIENRGYVETKKQFSRELLQPTETGEKVVERLEKTFAFMDYNFTRDMEAALDSIAAQRVEYRSTVEQFNAQLQTEINAFNQGQGDSAPACEKCGKPMRKRQGKFGAFWGCSGYPNCKHSAADVDGQPAPAEAAASGPSCPECSGVLRQRQGSKGTFWGCSRYNEGCKFTCDDRDGQPNLDPKADKKSQ